MVCDRVPSRSSLGALALTLVLALASPAEAQDYPADGGGAGYAAPESYDPGAPGGPTFWRVSPKLSAGAIIPFGDGGYGGSPGGGMSLDAAIWAELPYNFALEMRVGLRFDLARGDDSYAEVPLDIGMFYTLGGPVALVFGGGVGAHHIWESRSRTITIGEVIRAETKQVLDDKGWGFGIYGRVGLLIRGRRRGRGSVLISGEINTTFIELNDHKNPTSVVIMAGVLY